MAALCYPLCGHFIDDFCEIYLNCMKLNSHEKVLTKKNVLMKNRKIKVHGNYITLFVLYSPPPPPHQQPSNDPVRQWISSRHSLTSTSQHKGVAPSSAPAAASSLKNRSMKGDHPLMGVPLHDIDLVNNSDLLQELMQAYGIMGVSGMYICMSCDQHSLHNSLFRNIRG